MRAACLLRIGRRCRAGGSHRPLSARHLPADHAGRCCGLVGVHHRDRRGRAPDRLRPRLPRLADVRQRTAWWPRWTTTLVEFGNRVVTGSVSIGVILAVLGAWCRAPRRRDLTWLSLGLVGRRRWPRSCSAAWSCCPTWHPPLVDVALPRCRWLIVADAVVLHHRAGGRPTAPRWPVVRPRAGWRLGRVLVGAVRRRRDLPRDRRHRRPAPIPAAASDRSSTGCRLPAAPTWPACTAPAVMLFLGLHPARPVVARGAAAGAPADRCCSGPSSWWP